MKIESYRDLKVWQAAMDLVKDVYELTRRFPSHEQFGLTSQLQRAAVSVPSNIAEGHARASTKEFLHHLSIALGSMAEVETQLLLAVQLGYVDNNHVDKIFDHASSAGRMLRGLQRSLKAKLRPP